MTSSAHALLASVFGFDAFRPGQGEIVESVAAGRDVLAIMPTGGGKSLCYQLPALMREGVTVVISPLIALMRDQVRALRENGVEAGALTSANTPEENEEVFAALDEGRLKLLYMAPERLSGAERLLRRINVSLLAVDEAHCVSQWGHDFRPDYLRIGELRRALGVQTAAFTATADEDTRAEIVTRLFDAAPEVFLRGFDRPNLYLAFEPKQKPRDQILGYVAARPERAGIVYCSSRSKTEQLAEALRGAGREALAYHAGLDPDTRREAEARFQREDGLIVCATVAFGMGVDKPDIRFVAHADLPKSVEAYYQEIGRAGRDGAPAETLTLFGMDDIRLRRTQIDEGLAPPERKQADHARLNALLALAEAPVCRRQTLLAYFGETGAEPCGNCDLCRRPGELFDGTEAVRKALSAMLRTEERFGAEHLISILRGEANAKITQWGHDKLPTFGVGQDYSKSAWRTIFRQMAALDIVRANPARHGALGITEAGRPVLRGEVPVQLRRDAITRADRPERLPRAMVGEADEALFSALKAKRRALAEAQRAPAYVVFPDATLIEMASKKPATLDEMARISGVGAKKLERYGTEFLSVIAGEEMERPHPARVKLARAGGGSLFDALHEAQVRLARGPEGLGKFLSCQTTTLARIAELRPRSITELARVNGMTEQKLERFGPAFLELIEGWEEG
ncbi:DNA helicase RecQ [Oceanicella sp. SM1341]|uniref:DNA helicase RecQ n=1 Tax=Oceanicella sp. SM1341 TaxID=1548889 RepID=UPI000E52F446|nr:DNA helicase RecQ [Oceanicella sp. SM1341]